MPRVVPASSRPLAKSRALLSLLLLAGQIFPPTQAAGYTLSQTGRWTPSQAWEQTPVHMMLLRGNGAPSHSTVLWWVGTGHHEQFYGGLWGWSAGDDNCTSYPDASVLQRLPFDLPGSASLFCAGHTQLSDGRAFLSGGTQPGTEFGIRSTYTFNAGADSNQAWKERDSLEFARWYPTATTLADGKALVTSGSHHQHLHFFGGLKDSETTPTDSAVFRYGIGEGGVSDPPVHPSGSSVWPSPREGHSSVYYGFGPTRIFGGKLGDRSYSNEVWQMRRESNASGADYDYAWNQATPGSGPAARWRHVAIRTEKSAAPMIVFGGAGKDENDDDVAFNDVWRYWFDTNPPVSYKWSQVTITNPTSSDAPGARQGHGALWHAPSRSALVFGGRSTPTGSPTDSALYQLAFSSDMTSATWSKLTATGPGPRAEMALAYSTDWTDGASTYAFAFGGSLANGMSNELWELEIGDDPDTCAWRQITYLGGTHPSPRAGHTLHAEGHNRLLYLFGGSTRFISGGDTLCAAQDDTVYIAHLDSMKLGELRQWTPYTRNSAALTGHTMVFEDGAIFARKPEVHTPTGVSGSWTTMSGSQLQDWYPQTFVLKPDTVFVAGPDIVGRKLALSTGNWSIFPSDTTMGFKGGGAVLYEPGRVLKAGSRDTEGRSGAASGATRSLNLNAGPSAYWKASSNSMAPRVNHNLVLLPNGQVLVVGGTSNFGNDNNTSAELRPEMWDPAYGDSAGQWTGLGVLDAMPTMRDYHSTALLLPDGRVLTGGGNSDDQSRSSAEIYCPPYLFNGDALAVRPTLIAATGRWRYGADVSFAVSGDTTIRRACLIHPGSTTHGQDMAQRYVPLPLLNIEDKGGGTREYFVDAPADSFAAPPGDYLLFVSNSAGVPAIAKWIRIGSELANQFDSVAPDTLAMELELITSTGLYPAITAPGDDGMSGIALDFDLRYSTSAITEGSFSGQSSFEAAPPPRLAGTLQSGASVTGLQPCSWYYVAGKTRDDAHNTSSIGGRIKIKTLCSGGGGGLSMGRARGEAGDRTSPRTGRLDRREVASSTGLGGSGSLVRLVGEFTKSPSPRWRLYFRDLSEEGSALGAGNTVVVQDALSGGGWATRSSRAVASGALGVRSLVRDGRVVFPVGTTFESVTLAPASFQCGAARHSRLGDVANAESPDPAPGFAIGDTLTMDFVAAETNGEGEDCFFRVSIPSEAAPTAASPRVGPTRRASDAPDAPAAFALHTARPNPFAHATSIRFDLPRAEQVTLEVFDIQGRRIATLVNGPREAGRHMAQWDGKTDSGSRAGGGVYLCRMTAGEFRADRRITLVP